MIITKQLETEIKLFLENYWSSYITGDLQTFATYLSDDYKNIGTTKQEIWNSKQEILDYTKEIISQMIGNAEIRNKQTQVFSLDPLILTHEFGDIYIKMENEWVFYAKIRLSSIIKQFDGDWKIIHQHGSYPDSKTEPGESFAFDKISNENRELKDAITRKTVELENKNRELEIETSLERVRTVAMSMNKPDDMLGICRIISEQLELLKVKEIRNVQTAIIYESKGTYLNYEYYAKHDKLITTEVDFKNHKLQNIFANQMLTGAEELFNETIKGIEVKKWYDYQKTTNQFVDTYLEKTNSLSYYWYSLGTVALGMSTYAHLNDDEINLFKRFRNVFELAYRRFIDIEQAEAQAREAKIELGLERVRARAMAMQKTEELADAAQLLYHEFGTLGIKTFSCGYMFIDDANNKQTAWVVLPDGTLLPNFIVFPLTGDHILDSRYKSWKQKEPLHVADIKGEVNKEHHRFLSKHVGAKVAEDIFSRIPDRIIFYNANFSDGYLLILSSESFTSYEEQIIIRFAKVFEQTYTRFLDLQKAEMQAKEAEIETALERVRSRTMGMQKSEELKEVIRVVYNQLVQLNIHVEHAGFIMDFKARNDMHIWLADKQQIPSEITIPYFNAAHWNSFIQAKEKGIDFFANQLGFEEKNKFYHDLFKLVSGVAEEAKEYYFSSPGLAISTVLLENVGLYIENFSAIPYTDEENNTLMRFGKVFQQTYTRFNDLQKAEEQTRESQIELALERVRARTMAMQKSDELQDAAILLFQQMKALGLQTGSCGFNIWDENQKTAKVWMSSAEGGLQKPFTLSHTESGIYKQVYEAMKKGEIFLVKAVGGKNLKKHFDYLHTLPGIGEVIKKQRETGYSFPETIVYHFAFFNQGYLSFHLHEHHTETHEIFKRFAKVFEQTYTRFLDLQKAEMQAKDAEIETALERIRSRTIGMQKSEELKEVIQVVYDQLVQLNIHVEHAGFIMDFKARNDMHIWLADQHMVPFQVTIPYFDSAHWNSFIEAKEKGIDFFANLLAFDEKNKFYQELFELIPEVPDETKDYYFTCPGVAISTVLLENVGLYIENFSAIPYTDEENNTLMRFGKVFQQTYTRFNDLQKAEEQAREAHIELGLERVRARTMAMQKSEELGEVAIILFKELNQLVENLWTCGFVLCERDRPEDEWWLSSEAGFIPAFYLPNTGDATHENIYNGWKNGDIYHTEQLENEALKEHYEWLMNIPASRKIFEGMLASGNSLPTWQKLHCAYFSQGYLVIITQVPCPEEQIFKRFAQVFDQTYTRFLDLQKAEAQAKQAELDLILLKEEKKRTEDALNELQAAQKQLIQSEKMASLGELTAGIAHEIQNPLNFVNNFSEINTELIEEMKVELEAGNNEDAIAIANDIADNEQKINHHGKRADAIVKGMLQHSRSSSGIKEPTNINVLADEYLRLAYHGLRAKDKSFNAIMKTDYDESIGNINIIPQDIGRVILNLITNAFYAVNEKKKQQPDGYEPTVSISTKKVDDKVFISVKDNGNGIPQKVLNKIFQPFFTTKPTGQGTGLGLSLSYDIVKAHGGELTVTTSEVAQNEHREGTTFIISLAN